MNPMQVIDELGVPGRLPVEAIRAAQADREAMVPAFLRTIDDFLELKAPVDPNTLLHFSFARRVARKIGLLVVGGLVEVAA